MSQEQWDRTDEYVEDKLRLADPLLERTVAESERAGLPPIAVTLSQGRLLELLAEVQGARLILELGVLGGFSTICLARALPEDGRLIGLELDPGFAEVARANIERAGLSERVEIRVGPALEGLEQIAAQGIGPFDLVFIDADKETTPEYFEWAMRLTRPGSVIITDNVVRYGALVDFDDEDPGAVGMRRFHELVGAEPRVSATTIQTVGRKGYDGFTYILVKS